MRDPVRDGGPIIASRRRLSGADEDDLEARQPHEVRKMPDTVPVFLLVGLSQLVKGSQAVMPAVLIVAHLREVPAVRLGVLHPPFVLLLGQQFAMELQLIADSVLLLLGYGAGLDLQADQRKDVRNA